MKKLILLLLLIPSLCLAGTIRVEDGGGNIAYDYIAPSTDSTCETPAQGALFSEGFEGLLTCYPAGTVACENENPFTVAAGTQTFGYALPGSWLTLNCSSGLRVNVDEASSLARLTFGGAITDMKFSFYMYVDASTAGTDMHIVNIGNSTTVGSSSYASVALWNNAGTITIRAGGGAYSARLPVAIDKLYKVTVNGNITTAASSYFKVEDCSSGTCTDVAGSPDGDFRATTAGGGAARWYFIGGWAGAGDISDITFDAIGVSVAD